jgi:hypothetical protein
MTNKDKEILVILVSSGKDTFLDIHQKLENVSDNDLVDCVDNWFRTIDGRIFSCYASFSLIHFVNCPDEYLPDYKFKDTDQFRLTEKGNNLLYQIQKEQRLEQLQKISIRWSRYATYCGLAGVIATVIGIIVAVLLS